jgi:microcystin-dependent protein
MTFKVDDRIFQTSVTNGVGDYTLDAAPTGFQQFSVLGNNNLTEYYATDGVNWESGIGTVLTGPNRLSRTHIKNSSNAGAAVNWAGGTTKNIRCGRPASMAVPQTLSKSVAGGATVVLTQDEQRRDVLEFTGVLTANISVEVDATKWKWASVLNNTTGAFTLTLKVNGQPGVAITQGKSFPVYCNGVDVVPALTDVALLGVALSSERVLPGVMLDYGGTVIPSGYLPCDGANVSRATYAALFGVLMRSSVVTFTNGTDKVNWAGHGLSNGDVFKFTTTGGAPAGLVAGTTYFVVNKAADDFQIAATEGGAAINFTSDGTGVHTGIHAPWGDGDGASTFGLPESRRRVAVGRGGTLSATLGARLGATGGAETHALTTGELPTHTPTIVMHESANDGTAGGAKFISGLIGTNTVGANGTVDRTNDVVTANSIGSGTAHNNMPPSFVVTKIIKT